MAVAAAPLLPWPGRMGVDFEERVDFSRFRDYRLRRARAAPADPDLGSLLVFDVNNIRYLTSTMIGEWARGKMARYALLARDAEPVVWDFGSAARHHRFYAPWLRRENSRAGMLGLRGSVAPDAGLFERAAREIKGLLEDADVAGMPVGVDVAELPMMFELQRLGLEVRDGQQVMPDARQIKSPDEVALLSTAASMVDGTYQTIVDALKPGIRENEVIALANKRPYELGSDDVEAINAVSGGALQPASAQLHRSRHPPRRPGGSLLSSLRRSCSLPTLTELGLPAPPGFAALLDDELALGLYTLMVHLRTRDGGAARTRQRTPRGQGWLDASHERRARDAVRS